MPKFQTLVNKTKAIKDTEVSEKAEDRFWTVAVTAHKVAKIGVYAITGAAVVVAAAVAIDKKKNPMDYTAE